MDLLLSNTQTLPKARQSQCRQQTESTPWGYSQGCSRSLAWMVARLNTQEGGRERQLTSVISPLANNNEDFLSTHISELLFQQGWLFWNILIHASSILSAFLSNALFKDSRIEGALKTHFHESLIIRALLETLVFLCYLDLREEVLLMYTYTHKAFVSLAMVCSWSYSCPHPCFQANHTCMQSSASPRIRKPTTLVHFPGKPWSCRVTAKDLEGSTSHWVMALTFYPFHCHFFFNLKCILFYSTLY